MIETIRSFIARHLHPALQPEDGGVGGLILAILVVILIVVVALIEWVF